jgi:hypothetical protein
VIVLFLDGAPARERVTSSSESSSDSSEEDVEEAEDEERGSMMRFEGGRDAGDEGEPGGGALGGRGGVNDS